MARGGRLGIGTPTKTIRVGEMVPGDKKLTWREASGDVTAVAENFGN